MANSVSPDQTPHLTASDLGILLAKTVCLKIFYAYMFHKILNGMANSVDPDQFFYDDLGY